MCLNPECKWITIIEDDTSGEKCYIHYKFSEDGTFEELYTEGDLSLKIYVDMMRDQKEYTKSETPHIYNPPKSIFNYPNQIGYQIGYQPTYVLDYAGNLLDVNKMNEIVIDGIIDLDEPSQLSHLYTSPPKQTTKNPAYKSTSSSQAT